MRQRKNTKFVKDVVSVGGRGKQPVKVFLVDPLWEESNHFEELAGTGFAEGRGDKFTEYWGGNKFVGFGGGDELTVLNYRLLRALSDFPLFVLISIDARTLVYKSHPLYPVASSFPFLD